MRSITTTFLSGLGLLVQAQSLFTESFEAVPAFTLNTADAGSTSGISNTWVVNGVFAGGDGTVDCSGFPLDFSVPATAGQPGGVTTPNGNYLHTASLVAIANGISCCSFGAADGFCTDPDNIFARMSTDVNTTGLSEVTLSFWWLCAGGNQNYGELWYSTNAGSSWIQCTTPITQYRNQSAWVQQSVTLPVFGNQATLRFGFRFHNGTSFSASDPGFAIDDVRIEAATQNSIISNLGGEIGYFCQGYQFPLPFIAEGTYQLGNVFTAQLSDAVGSFATPVTVGTLTGTGSGMIDCAIPLNTPGGTGYLVRVVSSTPSVIGTVGFGVIHVLEAPFAGVNDAIEVCPGAQPFTMDLGGDPGGTWSGPSLVQNGIYDPETMDPGTYIYSLPGYLSCPAASAQLTISELPGANAGTSAVAHICKNTGVYELFTFLEGAPDTGGTWLGPNGSTTGLLNSSVGPEGIYTYTVSAGGACGSDEAVVTVELAESGRAGADATWTVCASDLPQDLFSLLVNANTTGIWYNNGIPFNGSATAAGSFTYIDFAEFPCPNDTAHIQFNVSPLSDAGENGTATFCSDDAPAALFDLLGGSPDPGGTWSGPGGPMNGTFNPATDAPGLYTYTVSGAPPCPNDEAALAVIIDPCLGIHDAAAAADVLIWRSTDGEGNAWFKLPAGILSDVRILDAAGRLVMNTATLVQQDMLRVASSNFTPGVYTLSVRTDAALHVARFVR